MGPIWRDPRRNSAQPGFNIMQNGWMATQLVPKRCDFRSLGVPGPASTPLGPGGGWGPRPLSQRAKKLILVIILLALLCKEGGGCGGVPDP